MKLSTDRIVVVEGKYDRARLSEILDATIIETNGFGIFKDKELKKTLRSLAKQRGLVVLTDSDSAGFVIRNHICNIVGAENVKNVYIPDIEGKERRKQHPSKEGFLGVEGMSPEILKKAFDEAHIDSKAAPQKYLTKTDFYFYGLSGGEGSAQKRAKIKAYLNLPQHLSANRLLEVLNIIQTKEDFDLMMKTIDGGSRNVQL